MGKIVSVHTLKSLVGDFVLDFDHKNAVLVCPSKQNKMFVSFAAGVSKTEQKSMRAKTRARGFRNRTDLSLNEIATMYNPVLMGWIEYYGRYCRSELSSVLRHFNPCCMG